MTSQEVNDFNAEIEQLEIMADSALQSKESCEICTGQGIRMALPLLFDLQNQLNIMHPGEKPMRYVGSVRKMYNNNTRK